MKTDMTDKEVIQTAIDTINDYGSGLSDDTARRAIEIIQMGIDACNAVDAMKEQASYALRYRSGEDVAALRRACKSILLIGGEE